MQSLYRWQTELLLALGILLFGSTPVHSQLETDVVYFSPSDLNASMQQMGHGSPELQAISGKTTEISLRRSSPSVRTPHLPLTLTQGNVFIQDSLNIGLESGATGYRLSVDGKIMCEELKVQSSVTWPDYVFSEHYPLLSLNDLEQYITQHQHLPNIPSATEIKEEGIMVGEMQRLMMEKIEELTLYILEQEKRIQALEARIENQELKIKN